MCREDGAIVADTISRYRPSEHIQGFCMVTMVNRHSLSEHAVISRAEGHACKGLRV
jgi:hypothetical protein